MMTETKTEPLRKRQRSAARQAEREVRRWDRLVDALLVAFHMSDEPPPAFQPALEALRHKRDTFVLKARGLKPGSARCTEAWLEYEAAKRELIDGWRVVISAAVPS